MKERTKDALEAAAATALALGGAAAVPAAAIPGALGLAWSRFHNRRMGKWWDLVVSGAREPADLAGRIEAGLANDDEHVVLGVVGGARAATSCIELASVPVVAEISRRFFQEKDLPRWFYRGALEVLERVDAVELRALRRLLAEVEAIRSDSITIIGAISGDGSWRAFQTSVVDPALPLTPFASCQRLFSYLKRAGLGFDSSGFGIGGSPQVVVLDREPATWLFDALRAVVADTGDASG